MQTEGYLSLSQWKRLCSNKTRDTMVMVTNTNQKKLMAVWSTAQLMDIFFMRDQEGKELEANSAIKKGSLRFR